MAKTTIYLPDHLAAELSEYESINVSGEAQKCLQAAIEREKAVRSRTGEMVEHVVEAWDDDGDPMEYEFEGVLLADDGNSQVFEYISGGSGPTNYLWVDRENERVYLMDDPEELVAQLAAAGHHSYGAAEQVAKALRIKPRRRL